jgi:hypothetical protein
MAWVLPEPRVTIAARHRVAFPGFVARTPASRAPATRSFLKMKRVIRPACAFPRVTGLVTATGLMGRVGIGNGVQRHCARGISSDA